MTAPEWRMEEESCNRVRRSGFRGKVDVRREGVVVEQEMAGC